MFFLAVAFISICSTVHAQSSVLVANANSNNNADLNAALSASFDTVDNFDLINDGTPSLELLSSYNVVVAYTNNTPADQAGTGNVLADYVDAGGCVVISTYALSSTWEITGRMSDSGYNPFTNTGPTADVSGNLNALIPLDPIFNGVDLGALSYFHNSNFAQPDLDAGATLVADDGASTNMIARNANGNVVGMNLFPGNIGGNNEQLYAMFVNAASSCAGNVAPPSPLTTFDVNFSFDDGNNVAGSVAHISCNGGLPLTNEQEVMDGDTITFVLEFPEEGAGDTDCEIWVDDVSGYTPEYDASGSSSEFDDDSDGCHYFEVDNGDRNFCDVDMDPDNALLSVYKTWDVIGSAGTQVNFEAEITVCSNEGVILGDSYYPQLGKWCVSDTVYGPGTDSFFVAFDGADFQGDNVYIYEWSFDNSVEVDISDCVSSPSNIGNGQGGFSYRVFEGSNHSCTINNTVFYEGIPTLNQYGLAIMALLMLGIGFVGFRRFV